MEFKRALRGLRRSPGFALGVIGVLGVTSAGLLTVASAAYSLFLKPLPYPDAGQLVQPSGFARAIGHDIGLSVPLFEELAEDPAVSAMGAYGDVERAIDAGGAAWQRARITPGLPQVMGVRPLLGHGFTAEDGEAGAAPSALISESAWRRRFGAREDVIGREIRLDGETVRIAGVMPDHFALPATSTGIWLPLRFSEKQRSPANIHNFDGAIAGAVARLAPGGSAAVWQNRIQARFAEDPRLTPVIEFAGLELRVESLRESWAGKYRGPLAILGVAVAMVLLAAVLNLAGIWAARMLARDHEQAVVAALGAGRGRSMAQIAAEYALLGLGGVLLALALTPLAIRWLGLLGVLDTETPITVAIGPVTGLLALAVLLLGALPVLAGAWWQASRQQTRAAAYLTSGGTTARGGPGGGRRLLIVVQIAVAMSLLAGVSQLLRSWQGLLNEDLGFRPQRLLIAQILPDQAAEASRNTGTADEDANVEAALERLRALPGADMVSHADIVPFGRSESITSMQLPGRDGQKVSMRTRPVGEDYFRAAGIDIIQGRAFTREDIGLERAVVDEWFARRYFPQGDAVGSRYTVLAPDSAYDIEIIGVARTVKHLAPDEEPEQGTEYRLRAGPGARTMAVIATSVPPHTLIEPARGVLLETLGPERITPNGVLTMQSLIRGTVEDREPQLILLGVFAALTLLLAAIGLYALLTYSVRARTAEFGLRMALGADGGRIRTLILRDGLRLLIPGLLLGTAGACLTGRLLAGRLYKIAPADPLTWLAVAALLTLVVLSASLWPALRAARTSPMAALRHD